MRKADQPVSRAGEWLPPCLPADELPPAGSPASERAAGRQPTAGPSGGRSLTGPERVTGAPSEAEQAAALAATELPPRTPVAGAAPGGEFASAVEALAAVEAGLAFLGRADAAALPAETLAVCLRGLGRAEAVHTAARSRLLTAFNAQSGSEADGHPTTKSWLRWQTRATNAAAGGQVWWMRRLAVHPRIARALGDATISPSWARQFCEWADKLPPEVREDADQILLDAAAAGAELPELSRIAEELHERTAPPGPGADDGPDGAGDSDEDGFADRRVWLDVHFKDAGRLTGDLTPECAAALGAVLDSLGKPAGPADNRSPGQRQHDALEEACRRLLGAGDLPDVAGQPAAVHLHVTLDQLQGLPGAAAAAARWAASGAGPGWLRSTAAAHGSACDARITPVVTGHADPGALAAAVRAFLAGPPGSAPGAMLPDATLTRLRDTLLRYALDLLSGPAGLAAALRAGTAGPHAAGVSLPLDLGAATATVPPHLRRAVTTRDRHCAFPGCQQRPAACQVHHVIPRSQGGATALRNLVLLCSFHHLNAIHRQGWTLTLHADGTTTATHPRGYRTYHSHSPPTSAAA
jgi:hypothetical protein